MPLIIRTVIRNRFGNDLAEQATNKYSKCQKPSLTPPYNVNNMHPDKSTKCNAYISTVNGKCNHGSNGHDS